MTCDEASHLISIGVEGNLSLRQRIRLKVHLFFCRQCRCFRGFVNGLQHKSRQIETADLEHLPALSDDVKAEIISSLNKQYGDRHTDEGNKFYTDSV